MTHNFNNNSNANFSNSNQTEEVIQSLHTNVMTFQNGIDTRLNHIEKALINSQRPSVSPMGKAMNSLSEIKEYISHGFVTKGLTSTSDGGVLMPTVMANEIIQSLHVQSPMRALSRISSISTDVLEILIQGDQADVGWVAETDTGVETKAGDLVKMRIPVHQMYAKPRATQKLLDDSHINIEQWLLESISHRMAKVENQAFLYGDGNGKPNGIFNHSFAPVNYAQSNEIETIYTNADGDIDDVDVLVDVLHALKTDYLPNAVWIMPRSTLACIRKAISAQGRTYLETNTATVDSTAMNNGWSPLRLMGYPIVLCDDMPALGANSISLLFGNFKEAYHIVDRSGIEVLRDPFSAKPYVEFFTTKRVGGDVVNHDAIKALTFGYNPNS
jgi:HK97 family phage major capsid protein